MARLDPKPCPFCGHKTVWCHRLYIGGRVNKRVPYVYPVYEGSKATREIVESPGVSYRVFCKKCKAFLVRTHIGTTQNYSYIRRQALEAWNQRYEKNNPEEKFQPCPCCGGKNISITERPYNRDYWDIETKDYIQLPMITCLDCKLTAIAVEWLYTEREVDLQLIGISKVWSHKPHPTDPIDAWNRRP